MTKPDIAIHKFSSCDGCQLAFLNLGEDLLSLAKLVNIRHFAEAGPIELDTHVDIAFIEGSVASTEDIERLALIRKNSNFVVSIGACATSGGLQALRNMIDTEQWIKDIYANPSVINSLDNTTPIADHIKVDLELWGCPVSSAQLVTTIRQLLSGILPEDEHDKVCMECKRQQSACVMITKQIPCMGAVTRTGCGAICPSIGRDCYACYGPAENCNTEALANRLKGFGLTTNEIALRFAFINNNSKEFRTESIKWHPHER